MNEQEQKAPFVSITLVCYNYAHLLSRALEAIGRQTFRDFEVIFIDNGGTDNSMQVAKEFFAAHPDIRATLLRNDDPDHSNAFGENLAVAHATGEYLLFHDADDWM
ncbi:MAG: glycosyltransferase family A protein, partial [Eubacteriales bacterium]|nr:glycosyltransferase family A protein [Eubacteriales bacterium]